MHTDIIIAQAVLEATTEVWRYESSILHALPKGIERASQRQKVDEAEKDRIAAWRAYTALRCEANGGSVRLFSDEDIEAAFSEGVEAWDL